MTAKKEENLYTTLQELQAQQAALKQELCDNNVDMAQLRKVTTDVSSGMKMLVEVWQQRQTQGQDMGQALQRIAEQK